MNGQDWLNYWQAQAAGDGEKRKADWLDAVTGALGAGVGLMATGGNPAGAMAGWGIGKSVGSVGENAVNHTLTPGNVMGDAMGGIGAYSGYQNGMTPISPQGGGTQPDLPMPMPGGGPGEDLLARLLGQYPMMGFADGGEVQPQQPQGPVIRSSQDVADFMKGLEEAINGMPGSTYTPERVNHPTLEMLASVVPDVVKALPAPRQTNSVNKTVGAWLPAAATTFSAPINYGKAQREERNKKGSEAARELANRRWAAAKSMVDSLDTQRVGAATGKTEPKNVTLPDGTTVPMTPGVASLIAKKGLGMAPTAKAGAAKAEVTPLTPEAVDQAAWEFAMTGVMPTFGRGPTGDNQRTIIRNRTAEMFPGLSVSENKAAWTSSREALKGLQKMLDAVVPFEETAIANSKAADEAMAAVGDAGGAWLNKPLRSLAANTGDPKVASLRAAIATIQPEFARILANPTLSGQLTDTARHEMQSVIDGNATLAQLRSVVAVLKRDARNRRTALEARIRVVRERLRTGRQEGGDAPSRWEDF